MPDPSKVYPVYRTRDLGLAAFLLHCGFDYTADPDPADPRQVWFCFVDVPATEKDAYFRGSRVSARHYYACLRRLKSEVYWRSR